MADSLIVMITHGIILTTAVVGAVSSLLNRKKLNKIYILVNGNLTERIAQAIKESRTEIGELE